MQPVPEFVKRRALFRAFLGCPFSILKKALRRFLLFLSDEAEAARPISAPLRLVFSAFTDD